MIYKNLIICGIILNLLWTNVICSKKNYLRGIDIIKMLENSERRMTTKLSGSKYSCNNKQDEGHYVHKDCRKYWHCLYVGTVFEEALERKCPAGTMFHPIQRICEMSPMLNCLSWYQYIYGKDLVPNYLLTDEDINSYTTSSSQEKIIDTSKELNELLVTFRQFSKISPAFYKTEFTHENYETDYEDSKSSESSTTTIETTTTTSSTTKTTTTTIRTTSTTKLYRPLATTTQTSSKTSPSEESYYIEEENASNSANEYIYNDVDRDHNNNYYDDYYYTDYPEPSGSYKIQINSTLAVPISKNSHSSVKIDSTFTTIFSSNLLEKLRNFKNENSQVSNEKNSTNAKNFTILSSNGKKTYIVQNEASTTRSYHNFSNNQRIMTTKSMQPIQIINNIFALNNRSNLDKNYVPNLSSRLFITEKMYAKPARTTTDKIMSYYEDVEAVDAEEVENEYMDNELMEVSQNFGQDLLLNLQLNIDKEKTTQPIEYQDYSDENAENFLLSEETVSSAWRLTLNLNIFFILNFNFYLLLF